MSCLTSPRRVECLGSRRFDLWDNPRPANLAPSLAGLGQTPVMPEGDWILGGRRREFTPQKWGTAFLNRRFKGEGLGAKLLWGMFEFDKTEILILGVIVFLWNYAFGKKGAGYFTGKFKGWMAGKQQSKSLGAGPVT